MAFDWGDRLAAEVYLSESTGFSQDRDSDGHCQMSFGAVLH